MFFGTSARSLEANGLTATPELVAAQLAKTWDDEKERDEWASLLLPLVKKHLGDSGRAPAPGALFPSVRRYWVVTQFLI